MSLHTLKLADVVDVGHNPRQTIDTKGEAFAELKASIQEHGILQPILVGKPTEDGKYPLIAGHRRTAVARALKLKEIPVLEAGHLEGAELAAALTENVIRENLTPIEEADALAELAKVEKLTQAKLAKRVGKSPGWVNGRLRLQLLPDVVRARLVAGDIALEATRLMTDLAEQDPAIAKAVAEHAPNARLDEFWTVARILDSLKEPFIIRLGPPFTLKNAVPDKARREPLQERFDAIDLPGFHKRLEFESEDIDSARAYGGFIEFTDDPYTYRYSTDPEWVADRVGMVLDRLEVKAAERAEQGDDPDSAAAEQERQAARERAEKDLETYHGDLLGQLTTQFKRVKPTLESVRVVALFAVGSSSSLERLGWQGPEHPGLSPLTKAILDATNVEEILGLVLQARLADRFRARAVDDGLEIIGHHLPGTHYNDGYEAMTLASMDLEDLFDTFALNSKSLPQRAVDDVKAIAEERVKDREEIRVGLEAEAEQGDEEAEGDE